MNQIIILGTGFVSIILAVYAVYSTRRWTQTLSELEENLRDQVQGVSEGLRVHVDTELEPLISKVNKAFGLRGEQGVAAKKLKTAEKYLVQDVLDAKNPMIMAALEAVSPRTKKYLEGNPELIMQLIPRLQALQSIEGFSPLDLFKPPGSSGASKKHPFGNREE